MVLAKIVLMAAMVVGSGYAMGAMPSAPTSQPATQVTDPKQVIVDFLKGLEQLPVQEHQGHKCGKAFKATLSESVSDSAVEAYSTMYGRGLANMSAEEIATLRESLVAAWTAMINYYRGYLMYDKAQDVISISMSGSNKPKPFRRVIPTSGPAYPGPVEVLVECVQEKGIWKINNLRLLPLGREKAPAADPKK